MDLLLKLLLQKLLDSGIIRLTDQDIDGVGPRINDTRQAGFLYVQRLLLLRGELNS